MIQATEGGRNNSFLEWWFHVQPTQHFNTFIYGEMLIQVANITQWTSR
jgi:hypothetical protein